MGVRSFQKKDIPAVQNILKEGEPYVFAYKEYVYWILERYFQDICYVFEEDSKIQGYIGAVYSAEKNVIFVWQIAVSQSAGKSGIGSSLFMQILKYAGKKKDVRVEIAINPENIYCRKMMKRVAEKMHFKIEVVEKYDDGIFQEDVYSLKALDFE
ncbi:GNAT family N-acetyltransferase [Anaerotignum sp.]|uniref:GNAT family N-acetyltransferase n=1 Tax=Anaerotignum sp. TaxID=2039241 RepID=UPI003736F1F5